MADVEKIFVNISITLDENIKNLRTIASGKNLRGLRSFTCLNGSTALVQTAHLL
jgi:hypothetical protein